MWTEIPRPKYERDGLRYASYFSRYFGRSPDRLGLEEVRVWQVLKISDIDSARLVIWIEHGKGGKDR